MSLKLVVALHNHQPVGNLPFVLADAYRDAYEPMLGLLERHPALHFVCHYTGPLLQWLAAEHPDFLDRVAALAARGQAEVLGGGLYEPILAVIPDADKVGQLRAMSAWIEQRLGLRPTGAWLAERVWEPHLPAHLVRGGADYTILDEEHFTKAGIARQRLDGYYTTEDQGQVLRLLPASTDLRYLIPWRDVEEVIAFLRSRHETGQDLLVFADDGEKFGSWPGTHQHVFDNGWLERFFSAVEANAGWLETTTPSRYLREHLPAWRVYIPSASYHEMEEWSLDPEAQRSLLAARAAVERAGMPEAAAFMRIGHWRNFLRRYPESSQLQQRATGVSARVHAMPPGPQREQALDHLWQGQCNCPYWHGVFGGIYMYHIRHATFGQVIAASVLAETTPPGTVAADAADYDADGREEARLLSGEQAVFVHPADGAIYEWDLRPPRLNLLNTLASYREAYTPGADEAAPGPRPRHAFADLLLAEDPDPAAWAADAVPDLAGSTPYAVSMGPADDGASTLARRTVSVAQDGGTADVTIAKAFTVWPDSRSLRVRFDVTREPGSAGPLYLAVDVCLAPPPGAHVTGSLACGDERRGLMEVWGRRGVTAFECESGGERPLVVRAQWHGAASLATHPLLSSHRTEHGEEHVYQGTRVVAVWPLPTGDGATWSTEIALEWLSPGG
ncbi:MAG: alpha-amylase/4-alpha-glucanotransferase domain-containing protein [Anaerolineae bacterium]